MLTDNHRKKDLLSNGIDGSLVFLNWKKIGIRKFDIAMQQSNTTWLQWNVLIIYSYIITSEGKKLFQIKKEVGMLLSQKHSYQLTSILLKFLLSEQNG